MSQDSNFVGCSGFVRLSQQPEHILTSGTDSELEAKNWPRPQTELHGVLFILHHTWPWERRGALGIKPHIGVPGKIQAWIKRELAAVGTDPARQRAKKNTLNGIIRNAKSLFGKKVLPFVKAKLVIPDPHPFKEIRFFPRQSIRYLSKIDPAKVIDRAIAELATARDLTQAEIDDHSARYVVKMTEARHKRKCKGDFILSDQRHQQMEASRREQWKIFVLALFVGMRFDEIDKLLWSQIDQKRAAWSTRCTASTPPAASCATVICVTAAHFLDQRNRVTTGVGVGGLLNPSNVVSIDPSQASKTA